ncbi:MAG TPA: HPr family phosphocarrier protein [Candidatus Limnocylindrales bacterium]|jgi:phosphotransferase system HPr (HPr) family protein
MPEESVVLRNASGLHARPAALFVPTAKRFTNTKIEVSKGDKTRDAKSILGVLTLAVGKGTTITIRTEGDQADAALVALVEAIESGLGE